MTWNQRPHYNVAERRCHYHNATILGAKLGRCFQQQLIAQMSIAPAISTTLVEHTTPSKSSTMSPLKSFLKRATNPKDSEEIPGLGSANIVVMQPPQELGRCYPPPLESWAFPTIFQASSGPQRLAADPFLAQRRPAGVSSGP